MRIWVIDQAQQKPACTVLEAGQKLENFGFKKMDCTIFEAQTEALISSTVTAKLVCVFVFAYASCWLSNVAAVILFKPRSSI